MGIDVANLDTEDVAEEMGYFVVVCFCDVALVELWFVLWQTLQRLVKDCLY